jgi:hypothetical protein
MKQSLWEATGGSATLEFPISFELKYSVQYSKSSSLDPVISHETAVCRMFRGSDRQSVTILSLWGPGLDPRSACMRFVVYKLTLGQAFLQVLTFSVSVSFHHCSIHIHSICHQHWQFEQMTTLLNNMLRKRILVYILTPCFFRSILILSCCLRQFLRGFVP